MDLNKIPEENRDLARRCLQLMDVFSSRVLSTIQVILSSDDQASVKLRDMARADPDKFMVRAIEKAHKELDELVNQD